MVVVLVLAAVSGSSQARPAKKKAPPPDAQPVVDDPRSPAPVPRAPMPVRAPARQEPAPDIVERAATPSPVAHLVLALGTHIDDATVKGRLRQSVAVSESRDEVSGGGPFGALGLLLPAGPRLRYGAMARYLGKWELDAEGNENRTLTLGYLAGLTARGEWVVPFVGKLDLLLAGEAGALLLFPAGDLSDEIDMWKAQGADVWGVPRLGYTLGPEAGMRYRINQRVALRVAFGASYSQVFLFFTRQDVGDVRFEITRRVNLVRYDLGLSVEAAL